MRGWLNFPDFIREIRYSLACVEAHTQQPNHSTTKTITPCSLICQSRRSTLQQQQQLCNLSNCLNSKPSLIGRNQSILISYPLIHVKLSFLFGNGIIMASLILSERKEHSSPYVLRYTTCVFVPGSSFSIYWVSTVRYNSLK